LSKKNVVKIVV